MVAQQFLVLFVEVRILVSLHKPFRVKGRVTKRSGNRKKPLMKDYGLGKGCLVNMVIIVLMVSTSVCGAFRQGSNPVITQLRMLQISQQPEPLKLLLNCRGIIRVM